MPASSGRGRSAAEPCALRRSIAHRERLTPAFYKDDKATVAHRCHKLAKPVDNTCLVQIVRRHFEFHSIPRGQPNKSLPHSAGNVREHLMLVVQLDSEHRPGKDGRDFTFGFDLLFCGHTIMRVICAAARAERARQ